MGSEFTGEPFSVEIKDEIAHLSWPDGARRCTPLRVFRADYRRMGKVLAEYDARRADVLPFKKRAH